MGLRPSTAFFRTNGCAYRDSGSSEGNGKCKVQRTLDGDFWSGKLGREERFRTVISGMEPRRIAVVMLLPRKMFSSSRGTKLLHDAVSVNK